MHTNDAATLAEVTHAFALYEDAVAQNNVALLNTLFWNDERAIRYGYGENLYGYEAIAGYRNSRPTQQQLKHIQRRVITCFGQDLATCNIDFLRGTRAGRQSQTWARFAEGWRIVSAHVSYMETGTTGETPCKGK